MQVSITEIFSMWCQHSNMWGGAHGQSTLDRRWVNGFFSKASTASIFRFLRLICVNYVKILALMLWCPALFYGEVLLKSKSRPTVPFLPNNSLKHYWKWKGTSNFCKRRGKHTLQFPMNPMLNRHNWNTVGSLNFSVKLETFLKLAYDIKLCLEFFSNVLLGWN